MKQSVTFEEYIALPEESQNKLSDWMFKNGYDDDSQNPTIGQMIEFVDEKESFEWMGFDYKDSTAKTLCDDLWESVKEILNRDD